MEDSNTCFGERKLYFLRISHLCHVLESSKREGLVMSLLGEHANAVLQTPALDSNRLADENNRILERTLHHLARGEIEAAQTCRALINRPRDRYTAVESVLTREPEFDYVQRLQRLYEGLSFYHAWLSASQPSDSQDDAFGSSNVGDEFAEKALNRLKEVEVLIASGYVCDVFIKPLVDLLEHFDQSRTARTLLVQYAKHVPENPNTIRYLCSWYQCRSRKSRSQMELISSTSYNTVGDGTTTATEAELDNVAALKRATKQLTKHNKRLLRYRIQFSKHVLPEPAPPPPTPSLGVMSTAGEKHHLRECHPHLTTILSCLKYNLNLDALEIAFALLDHPSWAVYSYPWELLYKVMDAAGKNSPELLHAMTIRKYTWTRVHFALPNLPRSAHRVMRQFDRVEANKFFTGFDGASLGPLLTLREVQAPMRSNETQLTDTSGMESCS